MAGFFCGSLYLTWLTEDTHTQLEYRTFWLLKNAEFKIHFIEYLCMLILSIYTLLNLSNVWIIPHTQIE